VGVIAPMGIETITLLIVLVMIGLMLLGVPLAWITMTLAVGCTLLWLGPAGLPLVASRVYGFVSEYVFVAVPLFVLMACILERSGVHATSTAQCTCSPAACRAGSRCRLRWSRW
jgi:TRAP-type mannitol/chloroaromatic compound transport system permease large subunit